MHERIAARRHAVAKDSIMKDDKNALDKVRIAALQAYNAHLATGIPTFETLGDALLSALQEMDHFSPLSKEGAELRRSLLAHKTTLSSELRSLSVQFEAVTKKQDVDTRPTK